MSAHATSQALHFNVHVDAADYPGYLARYINDNLDQSGAGGASEDQSGAGGASEDQSGARRRNVKFVKDAEQRTARVMTLREIQAGEELYAEYGDGYWRHHSAGTNPAD